jgi:SNF2 family DNA or RNA helicase
LISLAVAPAEKSIQDVWKKALGNSHVIITNYEQIRGVCQGTNEGKFDLVVADEAHRLRNSSSQIFSSFRELKRERFWALTGTPIERDIHDLATLMSLIDPKKFSVLDAHGPSAPLREKSKPYILRRTKESVLSDLPEVINLTTHISLCPEQLKTYRQVQFGRGCNGDKIGNGLQKLGELRRVCDFDPVSKTSSKIERIIEDLLCVKKLGEKAIVFSYIREPLDALYEKFSGNFGSIIIDGRMTTDERREAIDKFKSKSDIFVLLASSKVASEGLTLVEANHVFFINRWWNPSSNSQARDRVNRIGQKRKVFIHEYVCLGTIEEDIEKLLQQKNAVYEDVIGQLVLTL